MEKAKTQRMLRRAAALFVATAVTVTGVPPVVGLPQVAFAKEGSALDIGHPTFKNTELLDTVYNLSPEDYTASSQLMKIYQEDLANGSKSFYIDRVLRRDGVANEDAGNNGNDDGNTFMTRGRALYMNTSDPSVIGFGGNTAYHQPMGKGDMYEIDCMDGDQKLSIVEDTTKRVNMPSHWISEYKVSGTNLLIQVQKFINYQNVAVTLLTVLNDGTQDATITLSAASNYATNSDNVLVGGASLAELTGKSQTPSNLTTVYPKLCATANGESFLVSGEKLTKTLTIPAGKSEEVKAVMAFTTNEIPESQQEYLRFLGMNDNSAILKAQKEEYNLWWAETMPYIDVPNKAIQKAIDYRWWLENFNKLDANIPGYDYQYPVTIEGVLGYNNAIALTQPMHLQDTKWMRDASLAYGQLLSIGNSSQSSAFLDNPGNRSNWNNHYGQYLGSAGLEAYQVIGGNKDLAETLAYYFEHDAKGQLDHYGNHTSATTPANHLIDYQSAFMTGNDADTISFSYPKAGQWKTHAENAYVYGSANAAATLYQIAGDTTKSTELSNLSGAIQSDILNLLWSDKDKAFETRAVDPQPGFVSNDPDQPNLIPYKESNNFNYFSEKVVPTDAASLAKYSPMLDYLKYADEFPIFPYYTANQQDNKKQAGSNNFSNINFTVQARAYEAALRTYDKEQKYVTDDMLELMVEWCAWNMYPDGGDIRYPNNNEFYNIDGKTNDTYYRSWIYHNILGNYNYIFVEDVAGLVPRMDEKLELDPIEFNYDHFMINNVRYHGDDVTVVWDDPTDSKDCYGSKIADGFSVYKDGTLLFTLNKKAHIIYDNGNLTFPDGEPAGLTKTVQSSTAFTKATDVVLSSSVNKMLEKSGIEANITSENLAKGKTVTASFTPDKAREASWANKHRADGTDPTSKAVNEEKPDPMAITDGVTVNMPFWGDAGSPNTSDSVVIDLAAPTKIDMMNLYFYNDRQQEGYAEPAKYTLEYWDGSTWKQVEDQSRTPAVPQANYNTNYFKAVTTDKVRVTVFDKEGHDTAITEVQLYEEGGSRAVVENKAPSVSLNQDTQKAENMKASLQAVCEDDGMPWEESLSYRWDVVSGPEGATTIFSNPTALQTTFAASLEGDYVVRFTADDGALSTSKNITVAIKKAAVVGSEDIATNATPSSDYTAGWENLNGINNASFEPASSNVGTGKGWGNWRGNPAGETCYVSYKWTEPVAISGCDIYWYDDAGGTRVPANISFQYKDTNGEWKDATMLTDFKDANKINAYNTIAFESFEATELRLNMVTQAAATGIYRFKVYGTPIDQLLPVYVGTKTGQIPVLPTSIYGLKQDGSLVKASVVWDKISEEQVKSNGEFTVNGVNSGTGKFVAATVYVRSDMDFAGITEVKDTTVNVSLGKEAVLPDHVLVQYNNGAYDNISSSVIWDPISKDQYAKSGSYPFASVGTVSGTAIKANLVINVKANLEALQAEITKAEAVVTENYTKASVALFTQALAKAREIASGSLDQTLIDAAAEALKSAREGLQPIANVSALTKSIGLAEELTESLYTKESYQNVTKALVVAKNALVSDYESQEKIDLANEMLKEAFLQLEKTTTPEKILNLTMDKKAESKIIADEGKNHYSILADGVKESDYVKGRNGEALALSNTTSFQIPAKEALATKSITISYWVKRSGALTGNNNILWAKKASTYNGNGFYLNYPVAEQYSNFFIMDGFNGFYVNEDPNTFLPENEWTNVVVTWDDATKQGAIYKNGKKQSIQYMGEPQSITGVSDAANVFGENGYPGDGYPNGMEMDDFVIYNNNLSSTQVQKNYEAATAPVVVPSAPNAPVIDKSKNNETGGVLSEKKETVIDAKTKEAYTKITMDGEDLATKSKIVATVKQNDKKETAGLAARLTVTPVLKGEEWQIQTKESFISSLQGLASNETPLNLKVVMEDEVFQKALKDADGQKEVTLNLSLPKSVFENKEVNLSWIKLSKEVLRELPEAKANLMIKVSDEQGNTAYEWKIDQSQVGGTTKVLNSMNMAVRVVQTKDLESKTLERAADGYLVTLKHKGKLPEGASLRVPVTKEAGFEDAKKVYVYRYNKTKDLITRLDQTVYKVGSDGFIELPTEKGMKYLILPKKIATVR